MSRKKTRKQGRSSSSEPLKLLTVDEFAAIIRMNKRWVYAGAACGRIPHIRMGWKMFFKEADVQHLLEHGIATFEDEMRTKRTTDLHARHAKAAQSVA